MNQKFSAQFLGGADPLGKQFRMMVGPGEPQHLYQIVGMVRNSKYQSLREDFKPTVFVAASQDKEPGLGTNIIVRSSASLGRLMRELKRTILNVDPGVSLQFQVFKTQVRESLLRERLMAALSGFFGFLAAILATVGLYGVISYMVARRRNEIGIRIALGANRPSIVKLVLREAGLLLLAGLAVGTGLSIAAARTASSLFYGVQPNDPVTIEPRRGFVGHGRARGQLCSGTAGLAPGAYGGVARGMNRLQGVAHALLRNATYTSQVKHLGALLYEKRRHARLGCTGNP